MSREEQMVRLQRILCLLDMLHKLFPRKSAYVWIDKNEDLMINDWMVRLRGSYLEEGGNE